MVPPRAQPLVKVGARAPVPHGVGAYDYTGLVDLINQTKLKQFKHMRARTV